MAKQPIIVNLFGAPGAGKSTGAAYIFSQLKLNGVNAELVTEFAKDKVWEENPEVFKNQAYIFGKQSFKLSRCKEKVDVIVTDSPLLLSIMYNEESKAPYKMPDSFNAFVLDVFNSYKNFNYLLIRNKPYNPKGRFQTEEESDALVGKLVFVLQDNAVPYQSKFGGISSYDEIVQEVLWELKSRRYAE